MAASLPDESQVEEHKLVLNGLGVREATILKIDVQDVDRDRDIDLLLHYEVRRTGIDSGDTSACLTGATFAGRTIVGCDSVKTK